MKRWHLVGRAGAAAAVLLVVAAAQDSYGDVPAQDRDGLRNLALLPGASAAASSVYADGQMPLHQIRHLNDGLYNNAHSWISGGEPSWCELDLGQLCRVGGVALGSEHVAKHGDRAIARFDVLVSTQYDPDSRGDTWKRILRYEGEPIHGTAEFHFPPVPARWVRVVIRQSAGGEARIDELEIYGRSAAETALPFPDRVPTEVRLLSEEIARTTQRAAPILKRLAEQGIEVGEAWKTAELAARLAPRETDPHKLRAVLARLRAALGELPFKDPQLISGGILFVKHEVYQPSHIYTEYSDAPYRPGGGVYLLAADGQVHELFDGSDGICRDPELSYDAQKILFSYRQGEAATFHIFEMNRDGSGLRQLTDGPFHDMYPTYLPDGRIAFISTRCKSRVLCFTTEAATLFVMNGDGSKVVSLSSNNVNEYTPSVLPDGRILMTRWEYMDKGADYSQSLWAVRPDGTGLVHLFGNNILQPYSYLSARSVPGTNKFVATLASHWGDHIGPIGLIDPGLGSTNPAGIQNLTPEYPIGTYRGYRDPYPLSADEFLVSYGPEGHYGLYLLDTGGGGSDEIATKSSAPKSTNLILLYLDPNLSSFQPIAVRPRRRPPVIPSMVVSSRQEGTLIVQDVYRGLGADVPPGSVKYLRVVEELRHELPALSDGTYQTQFLPLKHNYASPTDEVKGPYGWPTYMAKSVHGVVPVEPDGSAYFTVAANEPLYLQALDGDMNEIQRMRSFFYLRPGETQTCVGCHESPHTSPPQGRAPLALKRAPSRPQPPEFGAGPFSFKKVVQPVLNRHCTSCHDGPDADGAIDLSWTLDAQSVPASYRTILQKGFVHFVNTHWNASNEALAPMSFGTLQSKLIELIDAHHYDVRLSRADRERITTWIDLNCPLWDSYEPDLRAQK